MRGYRRLVQDRVEHRGRSVALERRRSSRHLVKHHAERKQVCARVEFFPHGLFRRHEVHRAHGHSQAGQAFARHCANRLLRFELRREFNQSKIQNFRLSSGSDEDVRRLDVTMHDAAVVRGIQSVGDLDSVFQQFRKLERPVLDLVLEGLPIEKLHYDEQLSFVLAGLVDGADVLVVERRRGARLALEAGHGLPVARHFFGEKFQRDEASQRGVFGLVDDTHPATTQFFNDAVVRNGPADQRRAPAPDIRH